MAMVDGKRGHWQLIAAHAFLITFIIIVSIPMVMVVAISFREGNLAAGDIIPRNPTLEHWALALGFDYTRADGTVIKPPFPVLTWLWNSIKVATLAAALVVLVSTTAAYAFARMRFRFKETAVTVLLLAQMFPAALALVAFYALFDKLGDYIPALGLNSHWSLIISSLGGLTMHLLTIRGYFQTIDPGMEEAAIVDGATRWQAFRLVLLPISVPVLAAVYVLAFISTIIEYPVASILLRSTEKMTLAVGSRLYLNEQNYLWGDFAAAAVLSGLPIAIVFLLAQKWLVSGLSEGGVKG